MILGNLRLPFSTIIDSAINKSALNVLTDGAASGSSSAEIRRIL
jgi:hypothetical protein